MFSLRKFREFLKIFPLKITLTPILLKKGIKIEGKEILTNDSGTVTVSAGTSGDATLIIEADTDKFSTG